MATKCVSSGTYGIGKFLSDVVRCGGRREHLDDEPGVADHILGALVGAVLAVTRVAVTMKSGMSRSPAGVTTFAFSPKNRHPFARALTPVVTASVPVMSA